MQSTALSLLQIEIGSLRMVHGLLRAAAIGVGMTAGVLLLALFWCVGLLTALFDALDRRAAAGAPEQDAGNRR